MMSPNDDKEVRRESYQDPNDPNHQVTRTTETVNQKNEDGSYGHGYLHGRAAERSNYRDNLARDSENTSRGLLVGVSLATVAALFAGFIWYANQVNRDRMTPVSPVYVPIPSEPQISPSPSLSPEAKQESESSTTTIIREVPVPVPQQQAPAPQPTAPDININVPNQAPIQRPATQQTPTVTQTVSPVSPPSENNIDIPSPVPTISPDINNSR